MHLNISYYYYSLRIVSCAVFCLNLHVLGQEECKRLRQSMKFGLVTRLKVVLLMFNI
jgi:hypothetical protein